MLVGASSGVVPLVSIIRYGAAARLDVPICLVCSSASFEDASTMQHQLNLASTVARRAEFGVMYLLSEMFLLLDGLDKDKR